MTFQFQNPQFLALLALIPIMALIWYWRGMRTVPSALALRLLAVALMVLAVAHPTQGRLVDSSGPVVILVDQSDSLTPQGQRALRQEAAQIKERLQGSEGEEERPVAVLWFGAHTVAPGDAAEGEQPPAELFEAVNSTESDLAGALETARDMLTSAPRSDGDADGHIILLSDGMQTMGDALAQARLVAESGVQVDILPLEIAAAPELRIAHINAPPSLHVGEEYAVQIVVSSTAPAGTTHASQADLRLWEGDELLAEEQVNLEPGENSFTFRSRAMRAGVIRLRAEVSGTPDTFAPNNSASATAMVAPPPRVLLVEGREGNAAELSSALWNAGVESDVIAANRLPTRLSSLTQFDGLVLLDVPAHELSLEQMTSVQEFVRSEGHGLVVAGGTNSFGLGAYEDTPLEEVLPVDMEAPPRPERSEVALLLIIDRSASMDTAIGISKFDMAKEAAILSTEALQSEDTIGVLAFDTDQQWTVPFQRIGEGIGLKQIQDNIAMLPTGGGTDIYNALYLGLSELQFQTASVRHVMLLTDGRSFTDDRVAYRQLAESALAQDITLSTIAIGFDSDTELLENLAQWGGGRYYFANEPEDIPRLTLQESEIARSDPSVEGNMLAQLAEPHPLMRDFAPGDLPQLSGYVATTPKDAAEIVLDSPEDDPLLVSWQYGLGRAVAWTPSVAEPWAANWSGWQDYGRFWAQIIRYTLPEAGSSALQVHVTPQLGGARLEAEATRVSGVPLDLATAVAQVTLPDGTQRTFNLRQVGPGRYVQDLLLPSTGPYGIAVALERSGQQYYAEQGYVQPVSAEYMPPDQMDSEQLRGIPLLEAIAQRTGGRMLDQNRILESDSEEGSSGDALAPLRFAWMWLLGAALLLWLLEIAVRRGLFVKDA